MEPETADAAKITYEEAVAAPRDLESGDRFELRGRSYLVLNRKDTVYHGRCFKLRCLDPKKEFDVQEFPEADAYEPESVDFFSPGVSWDLTERYPQAAGFRLRAENPHIRLETVKQAGALHTCMISARTRYASMPVRSSTICRWNRSVLVWNMVFVRKR